MQIVESVEGVREARQAFTGSLGLVPTMGYLHEGHLALVQAARVANDHVAVSIFVNPTQFGPHEDYARYPRDLAHDLALLEVAGVDLVWAPTVVDMYPQPYRTYVEVEGLTARLEGAARPGHFRGVATVVCKLFTVVAPQRAYFGQKDAQQLLVIRRMARDLNLPLEVVGCPTMREADGLAMSSRNVFLAPEQRRAAPTLYRALRAAAQAYAAGERNADLLRAIVAEAVRAEPLLSLEYASLADIDTLDELDAVSARGLLSLAARCGSVRLIDNLVLGPDGRIDQPL
jgi:pantoate--beta-alanine ligase